MNFSQAIGGIIMKVILVNGSPNEKGCTYTALTEVASTLQSGGIETEIFWIGKKAISGCQACGYCMTHGGKCVISDIVNEFRELASSADGFIFGTPVYFAGINGSMVSFMDRLFFSEMKGNEHKAFRMKPAAAVISARRGGTTTTFDQMNKYITISQMPVVTSAYWNMVHGMTPEEVKQDEEGMYVMRTLGRNMAYMLKCIEAGKNAGVPLPEKETPARTNFIR